MDAPATSAWISRAGMAAAGTPESWMPSMMWHVGCIRTACAAHLVNSKGKHHVNPMSNCQTVQWTLLGTCNANVVLGIFAWRQRLHGIAMYKSVKKQNIDACSNLLFVRSICNRKIHMCKYKENVLYHISCTSINSRDVNRMDRCTFNIRRDLTCSNGSSRNTWVIYARHAMTAGCILAHASLNLDSSWFTLIYLSNYRSIYIYISISIYLYLYLYLYLWDYVYVEI